MAAEPELTVGADPVGHIVKTKGVVGGKARIAGTRIRVMDVVIWYEGGSSVAEIIEQFPHITAADVHAAMAYYHDNRDEIEATLEVSRRFEEEFRRDHPEVVLDVWVTAASFVLDENVASAVANGLRRVAIDAVTLGEVGRLGLPDPGQLQWAFEQGRVVMTHDEDYVSLAYSRAVHAGVGYCHQEKYQGRPGALIRRILQLHAEMEAEEWANRVVFL